MKVSIEVDRGRQPRFTAEAHRVQDEASMRRPRVVRMADFVFFSTRSGDAWILHVPADGALCLARAGESLVVDLRETPSTLVVDWNWHYAISDTALSFTPRDGGPAQTPEDYPTTEVIHLLRNVAPKTLVDLAPVFAAMDRLKKTGRNDPCPCGSGRKYKKCCLDRDEALVRSTDTRNGGIERFEVVMDEIADESDLDDEFDDDDDVSDSDGTPVLAGAENDQGDETGAPEIPPEVDEKLNAVWNELEAHEHPSAEQIDRFLEQLVALPPEATDWNDTFSAAVDYETADFARCVRRISEGVPHTKAAHLSYFYWEAVEQAIRRGRQELLPEIVAGICRLDRTSYDADALKHIEDWLLAAGRETELLKLLEHFVPVLREDGETLMPYALSNTCDLLFELRCGMRLRGEIQPGADPGSLADELRQGIEDEVAADVAASAAAVIMERGPTPAWTRDEFELVKGDISKSDKAWQHYLRLNAMLLHVAREAWSTESYPAGCALRGLMLTCNSFYERLTSRRGSHGRKASSNLLDCLRPRDLEPRIARVCRDVVGVNRPLARLLLDAHGLLLRAVERHHLIAADDAAATACELRRLATELGE